MALRHYSNAKPWLVEFDTQSLRLKQVKYESDKMTIIKTMNKNINLQAYHDARQMTKLKIFFH